MYYWMFFISVFLALGVLLVGDWIVRKLFGRPEILYDEEPGCFKSRPYK
jgi:O-antigen/teichoic acid export membrane protein